MKKFLFLALSFSLLLTGCGATTGKLLLVTTIYPLTDIARIICKDKIDILQIVPDGTEPHEWDPSPSALAAIPKAAIFVAVGPMLEPLAQLDAPKNKTILLCENAELITDGNNVTDPHIWLNPQNMIKLTQTLTARVCAVDTANSAYYQANADKLIAELTKLDSDFKTKLLLTKKRDFVTMHSAFAYLAKQYGLTQYSLLGSTPESEPSAKSIVELKNFCRAKNIHTLFYEPRENEKLARSLAADINARILPLDPLEMAPADGQGYIQVMRQNLDNLLRSLDE